MASTQTLAGLASMIATQCAVAANSMMTSLQAQAAVSTKTGNLIPQQWLVHLFNEQGVPVAFNLQERDAAELNRVRSKSAWRGAHQLEFMQQKWKELPNPKCYPYPPVIALPWVEEDLARGPVGAFNMPVAPGDPFSLVRHMPVVAPGQSGKAEQKNNEKKSTPQEAKRRSRQVARRDRRAADKAARRSAAASSTRGTQSQTNLVVQEQGQAEGGRQPAQPAGP